MLVNFDGGELQEVYEDLNDEYEDSVAAADEVLFEEWACETA